MVYDANGNWTWTSDDNLPSWDIPSGGSLSITSRVSNLADLKATAEASCRVGANPPPFPDLQRLKSCYTRKSSAFLTRGV